MFVLGFFTDSAYLRYEVTIIRLFLHSLTVVLTCKIERIWNPLLISIVICLILNKLWSIVMWRHLMLVYFLLLVSTLIHIYSWSRVRVQRGCMMRRPDLNLEVFLKKVDVK